MNVKGINFTKLSKIIIFNAAFLAVLYFAYKNIDWDKLTLWELPINYYYIFTAIVFYFISALLFSMGWSQIVKLYNKNIIKPVHLSYLGAQLFKYLPSSLFLFSAQVMLNKKMQVGYKKSFAAFFIQYCFVFWAAAVLILLFDGRLIESFLIGNVFVLFLILVANKHRYKLPGVIEKFISFNEGYSLRLVGIAILHLFAWIVSGLALHLTTMALGIDIDLIKSMAVQPLSSAISILAVFAPGGIGVREYVLSTSSLSVNTIVVWRLITTIADVAVGTIALTFVRKTKS